MVDEYFNNFIIVFRLFTFRHKLQISNKKNLEIRQKPIIIARIEPRTTDAQRGNSLHCTAENSLEKF